MIQTYLKIAWRNLKKNKTYSFINIFGLSCGLASCMLIALYIRHETGYDRYHKYGSDIYQLASTSGQADGGSRNSANTPAPMAPAMKSDFPEVADATHLLNLFADDKTLLQYQGTDGPVSFYETNGFLADSSFFRMFDYQFIEGNQAALDQPNTVVLSETIARKLFGRESAINRVVHISSNTNGAGDYAVTGVFRPATQPSHINGRFFLSIAGGTLEQYLERSPNDFVSNNMFFTYLKLRPGSDPDKLMAKFPAFIDTHAGKDLASRGASRSLFLIPLREIHLSGKVPGNVTPPGNTSYLYVLASIAAFILLIACINFMNLSTARSAKRSAEVGVRKVMGAGRSSLIHQFLGESLLMALIAFLFAIGIVLYLLPLFNQVSGKNIAFSPGKDQLMIAVFLGMALITGILAGSYPAFYLSSFRPVQVLKGKMSGSLAAVSLRRALVVLQFVISVVLIVASIVITSQMKYMQQKDLGFTKEQQLVVPLRSPHAKDMAAALKNELAAVSQVSKVGATMYYPGIFNPSDNLYYRDGQSMKDGIRTRINRVDFDFLPALGVHPVAGRLFSPEFPSDTASCVVVNESLVHDIGFPSPADAVNQQINFDWQGTSYHFRVIGVVRDFHHESLHLPIAPFAFEVMNNKPGTPFNYLLVHTRTSDMQQLLREVQNRWHLLNPDEPFEYSFIDTDFMKNYEAERRLSSLVGYFTIIAIIISCLGLFGLSAFSAEQRTREIGIRKVLGASVTGVTALLSRDFLKLVGIAMLIALPAAWWIMHRWLLDFAYRTGIGWQVFVITVLSVVVITLLTISFQAVKAALANPAKSLRTE